MGTYLSEVLADSPVGLWMLDEASGDFADSSGNANDAAVSTFGTALTYGVTGPIAGHNAVKWNGGAYAAIPTAPELHPAGGTNPWSLEAWFKGDASHTDFNSPAIITAGYSGSSVDYLLGLWNGTSAYNKPSVNFYNSGWQGIADSTNALDDATWHHIVATFDGTDLRLYLDKTLIDGPTTPGATPSATTQQILLGCRWDNTSAALNFATVAAIAVYATALSSTRIAAHYDNASTTGTDNPQSVDVGATGTVALAAQKTKTQSIAAATTFTATLSHALLKGQSIAVGATLTASLTKIKTLTKAISTASTVTAALSEVAAVAAHLVLNSVLPSFKQRLSLAGSGTGFVPPDFTIDLHSSPIIGATFAGLRASWTADGPGAMEVDLRPTDINDNWTPGADSIVLNWGGGPIFAGPIERLEQSGPPEDVRFTASALGWASRLDYRIVRHEFDIRDNVDVMVSALLDEAQTQFNGDMGFAMGTVSGTTANRLRNYCFGVNIGDAIRELAQVGHGFDWEIDANLKLNIWQNTRGVHTGKTLQDSDTSSWSVSADTADALTNVSSIGSQDQPFGPIHRLSYSPGLSTVYGRREIAIDVDSTDETELFDSGDAELATRAGARMQVQTMWIDDRGPWAFGEVWLQDIVSVVLPTYFGGTQDMRCTEINLSLEPGTHYYVEHTFEALCVDITQAQDDGA